MKKSALVTALAAAVLSTGAYAERAVNAVFTNGGVEMYVGTSQIAITCPAGSQTFSVDGAGASQIQLRGDICLDPTGTGGPLIRLDFNATGGYDGTGPNPGSMFVIGSIDIEVQTTDGWFPYGLVDASTTNIQCLQTASGGLGGAATTGLQLSSGNTIALPGLWDGVPSSPSEDRAVCVTTLFGNSAALFLEGKITAP